MMSFFILICAHGQAEIHTISLIEDMRSYVTDNDSLVLFDVDDTLIASPTSLGGIAWRPWARSKLPKGGTDFVLYDALTLYIAKKVPYIPVEPAIPRLISDLQQEGVTVLALTSRGRAQWYTTNVAGIDALTIQQLKHVGMDFARTAIPSRLKELKSVDLYEGILFAEHISKGDLLKTLLSDSGYRPAQIIFVDDRFDHIQSVEAAAQELRIPFIGFWYKRAEINASGFDPMVANVQFEGLFLENTIYSEAKAKAIAAGLLEVDPVEFFKEIVEKLDLEKLAPAPF